MIAKARKTRRVGRNERLITRSYRRDGLDGQEGLDARDGLDRREGPDVPALPANPALPAPSEADFESQLKFSLFGARRIEELIRVHWNGRRRVSQRVHHRGGSNRRQL